MNLNILLLLPLLTVLLLLWVPPQQARWWALVSAVAQLLLCMGLLYLFVSHPHASLQGSLLFQDSYTWFVPLHIHLHTGVDGISVAMLLLTAWVVLAGVLVSWQISRQQRSFFALLMLLSVGAYGFFIALDLFTLFFFLELAVIPKFLLIGIWGSGAKEKSATKLALMLIGASALIFVGMAGLYLFPGGAAPTWNMTQLAAAPMAEEQQLFFFPFLFVGFGVFTAIFPFHTWVPDGHSSAPTAASMFLAGISMKLGGYGCLRVATWLMPEAAAQYSPYIVLLAAVAILYGALATMMQTDLKYINAYSSISHCGFVLLGIGVLTHMGIAGAVVQMVSHGLMTALFFAIIGMVYERTHTRQVSAMGGLLKSLPFISTLFVLVGLCSLGLPGFSGFVAEMMVFTGAWARSGMLYKVSAIAAMASIVVTAIYILNAIGKVVLGPVQKGSSIAWKDAHWYEKSAALLLMAGILLIGLLPFLLTGLIEPGVQHLLQQLAGAPQ